jgi:tryptophan synthase alpha chain
VASGFDGIIVPDLPHEESGDLRDLAGQAGLSFIPLVAPTSRERITEIVSSAQGFVYCVSSLGTTGMRQDFAAKVEEFLKTVRSVSPVPTAVGFGISTRAHVTRFLACSDAVVVGSALVKQIAERRLRLMNTKDHEAAFSEIRAFVRQLKKG